MERSGRWRVVIVVSALSAGIGIAILRAPEPTERPAADHPPVVVALPAPPKPSPVPATPKPIPATATSGPSGAAAPPPRISAEQWAALRADYADRPAELRRLADHFTFADQIERFRSGRAGGSGAAQLALARSLDAGLDERLRERELGAAEARLIKVAVLEVLLDDEEQRREALERWEASLAPPAPDPARIAVEADFQRRQAEIVTAWRALPADQRDPRALESKLQTLRVSSFDNQQQDTQGAQR